jgi:NADPH-dependent curcumin reductase CurA
MTVVTSTLSDVTILQLANGSYGVDATISDEAPIVEGLEAAPEAFIGILSGRNFGKLLVKFH